MGFPGGSDCKESACNARYLSSDPGERRFPGKGNDYPLQHSCLETSMDRGAWWTQSMEIRRVGYDWAANTFT